MDECLICEKEKIFSSLACKMCGMGVENKIYKFGEFVFCSKRCMSVFKTAMKKSSAFERNEMIRKDVII